MWMVFCFTRPPIRVRDSSSHSPGHTGTMGLEQAGGSLSEVGPRHQIEISDSAEGFEAERRALIAI